MKKNRFLFYLPPRELLLSWRTVPAVFLYLCGLGTLLFTAMFSGYLDPLASTHKSTWRDAFDWHILLISFLLCFIAPLIAPTILRSRIFLLVLGLIGFAVWMGLCYLLYLTLFGSLSTIPRADIKYHFL